MGEWKWDGIRVQAAAGIDQHGQVIARALFAHGRGNFPQPFPICLPRCDCLDVIDGELLVVREGGVQSFNVLQQRLNRKTVTEKLLAEFPAHLRAYDLLMDGEEDLRALPFSARRARLEEFVARPR